jgi:beta-glucanase (GH16 family)
MQDGRGVSLFRPGNAGAVDQAAPAHAVELASTRTVSFGRFEAAVNFARCAESEELVNGIFTYHNDGTDQNGNGIADNSEIDIELLCGRPNVLWLTVWTDYQESPEKFRKRTRSIDMRTGRFEQTAAGREGEWGLSESGHLELPALPDFPNPAKYYTLGFEWRPTYVRYFIKLDGREVTLWRLEGAAYVPQRSGAFLLNLWHPTTHWTGGGAAAYPALDAELRVDNVRIWKD